MFVEWTLRGLLSAGTAQIFSHSHVEMDNPEGFDGTLREKDQYGDIRGVLS